jgi:hypothetical protein
MLHSHYITIKLSIYRHQSLSVLVQPSSVPREGGGWGVQTPPEIPKFWQTWAKFPVQWKIHPQQPSKNTGFTHLHVERDPSLGGYHPQTPLSLPSVLNWICWTPLQKKFLGTPLVQPYHLHMCQNSYYLKNAALKNFLFKIICLWSTVQV